MKQRSVILAALAGIVAYGIETSFAAEPDCAKPSLSQEIYECSKIERAEADTLLNEAYRRLGDRINTQYKSHNDLEKTLRNDVMQAQNAWIRLRDADCNLEAFVLETGSQAFETTINRCVAAKSFYRSTYLDQLFK